MQQRFLEKTNRPIVTMAVLLCIAMGSLEVTVVATAMPKITAELHGIHSYAWVTSIYLLTSTVLIPIYGKLGDLYKRRPVMIVGICIFLLGSLLSGFSKSMNQLILFRALQGIGAGGLQALAFSIIADLYTPKERSRIQGIFGATWAVSGILGSFLGGIIVSKLSWGWIFFMNVPLGLLSIVLLLLFLHERQPKTQVSLDLLGALLLSLAIIALLLGVDGRYPVILLPSCGVFVLLFILHERTASEPLIPLHLFSDRVIGLSVIIGALVGAMIVSTVTYLSLFLQGGLAYSATMTGLFLAPVLLSWPLSSTITGWIIFKVGYRPLVILGFFLVAASCLAFAFCIHQGVATPIVWLRVSLAMFGIGLGMGNTATVLAIQEKATYGQRGVAAASISFSRSIGSAVGVGSLGALLTFALRSKISSDLLERLVSPLLREKIAPWMLTSISTVLIQGIEVVFWGIAAMALIAFAMAVGFPAMKMSKATSVSENKDL